MGKKGKMFGNVEIACAWSNLESANVESEMQ